MRVTFLGTGTSVGVPMVGCDCATCCSDDPRDNRLRSSIHVEMPDANWIVDTGPDLRQQCLRTGITRIDAVLMTHSHSDHVMGFDELRRFTIGMDREMPVHATAQTMDALRRIFFYAFDGNNRYPGYLKPAPRVIDGEFQIGATTIHPFPVLHGKVDTIGFLFVRDGRKLFAYIPDCKTVLPQSVELLHGTEVLVIDALRYTDHPTHMNLREALDFVATIEVGQTFLTHFSCEVLHVKTQAEMPAGVQLAYDGLVIDLPLG